MNSRFLTFGVATLLFSIAIPGVYSGECVHSEVEYITALEGGPRSHKFRDAVYCLSTYPIVTGRFWAGPHAAAVFAALRADTLQARLEKAISALLHTSWADSI